MKIPIIDLACFRQGNFATRQAIAAEIYGACHAMGFIYLKNHGVDSELIDRAMRRSQQFFQLPLETKNCLAWADKYSNRGYVAVGRERLDETKPGDFKEAFNIGKDDTSSQKIDSSQQDCWLEEDLFNQTMQSFFAACITAANTLAEALALALALPESFFVERHNRHDHTLRLLHYPPVTKPLPPKQARAGEHSDYGSFTLLFQDAVGGLEVFSNAGRWIEMPFVRETAIFNIGDLMQRWTNDVFRSTKHRVVVPDSDRASQSRYSIAFFCHPNDDTEISCLPTCQSSSRPPRYPPITAKDYLLSRLQATY